MGKAITISKDYGCGGLELASALAKELDYEYIDKGIIVELAKKMNTSEAEVSSHEDGKAMGLLSYITKFMTSTKVKTILSEDMGYLDDESYKLGLEVLMRDLADRGSVVIVGRGGQCILKNRPDVVHVRLVGPMEFKKKFIAEKQAVSEEEALNMIKLKEEERRKYIEKMFAFSNNDPELYHITINLGEVKPATAIDIIKMLL